MSQRNPMNDRYQTEEHQGKTRKSAASMKPKTKAASSVRIKPVEKTKQQKKAEKKVERSKQAQLERKYYNPPTAEYKRLRKIWWALLIGAIVMVALSWLGRGILPEMVTYVTLGLAYVCIIGALYVDFSKIRKARRRYAEEMEARKSKEVRAVEKQQKQAARQAGDAKGDGAESEKASEEPKKRGLFGSGFRLSNREKAKEGDAKAQDGGKDAASGDQPNEAFERGKANASAASKAAKAKKDSEK